MESILVPFGVALATGLAYFAFKYPNTYDKLFKFLSVLLLGGFIYFLAYNIGVDTLKMELEQSETIKKIADSKMIPMIYFWILLAAFIYLMALSLLQDLIKKYDKK